jgi:hypothetical protein
MAHMDDGIWAISTMITIKKVKEAPILERTIYRNKFQVDKSCKSFRMSKKIHATRLHWSLYCQMLQYLPAEHMFYK